MAIQNIVEYTENGLKIGKPNDGEKHLVYVRPGDQIKIDFSDSIQYRIIDGDVLGLLPNGAQLVFLGLGSMTMTPNEQEIPKLIDAKGEAIDILNVAEITELTDQIQPVRRRFLEFQPQSEEPTEIEERLSKQQESLENTLETINEYVSELANDSVAGPQANPEAQGEESSGEQSTVEFVQETVEKVVRATEETTIPEPIQQQTKSQIAEPRANDNPSTQTSPPSINNTLQVGSIEISGYSGNYSGSRTTSTEFIGGSGGVKQGSGVVTVAQRQAAELINTSEKTTGITVQADNTFLSGASGGKQYQSQIISFNPTAPDNFIISKLSLSNLPAGAQIYAVNGTNFSTANIIQGTTVINQGSAVDLTEGVHFTRKQPIQFLIRYNVTDNADGSKFSLTVKATATFDTGSGVTAPAQTTYEATQNYSLVYRDTSSLTDNENALVRDSTKNEITTGTGNDVIVGGDNVDIINSGEGNDTLTGGKGNDTLMGGSGQDSVSYTSALSIVAELKDGVNKGTITSTVSGATTPEIDTVYGIENVTGSGGNDVINGNSDINILIGGAGDDSISGGYGNDTLDAGAGNNDTLSYAYNTITSTDATHGYSIDLTKTTVTGNYINSNSSIAVSETDNISGFEHAIGSSLNDTITGTVGNNSLSGGAGNDTISGGTGGIDTLDGGTNSAFKMDIASKSGVITTTITSGDTVDLSQANRVTTLDLGSGVATTTGATSIGSYQNFENVKTSSANDIITAGGDGNTTDNIFYASLGNDNFNAGGNQAVRILDGTGADPKITVLGGDTLDLSLLDTTTLSGSTVDLTISTGAIVHNKTAGGNVSQTATRFEHVVGSSKDDTITGTTTANYLAGGKGNDVIHANGVAGGTGIDFVDGGEGTDTASFDKGYADGVSIAYSDVTKWHIVTSNVISSAPVTSAVVVNTEKFIGTGNADQFRGSAGSEYFDGGAGNDIIHATRGGDTIIGGDGTDTLQYSGKSTDPNDKNLFLNETGTLAELASAISSTLDANQRFSDSQSSAVSNLAQEISYNSAAELSGVRVDMGKTQTDSNGTYYEGIYAENTRDSQGNFTGTAILRKDRISGVENIDGTEKDDYIAGDINNNVITGGAGDDFLAGRGGNDNLDGGIGDDILMGGSGVDTLNGGVGNDWVSYQFAGSNIVVDLAKNTATGGDGADTLASIEHAITGAGADTLTGINSSTVANILKGGAGNDTLNGGGGADTLDGGLGEDTVSFGSHVDSSGSTINPYSNGVTAILANNAGNDTASYTATGATTVTSVTLTGIENLIGSSGNDAFTGNSSVNTIAGGAGNDTLDGTTGGIDVLQGDAGDDTIKYTDRAGTVDGGLGIDTLDLSSATSSITIDLSKTEQKGATGDINSIKGFENVTAGDGVQNITASTSSNIINTGKGNDTIKASAGSASDTDTIDGGVGTDTFEISNIAITGTNANFASSSAISITSGSGTAQATLSNIEKIDMGTVSGSTDTITLGGSSSTVVEVSSGAGSDTISIDSTAYGRNNTVDGGTGTDTLKFLSTAAATNLTLIGNGIREVTATHTAGSHKITNFETIDVTANTSGDKLTGSGILTLTGSTGTVSSVNPSVGNIIFKGVEILDNTGKMAGTSNFNEVNSQTTSFKTILAGGGNDSFTVVDPTATFNGFTLDGGAGTDSLSYTSIASSFNLQSSGTGKALVMSNGNQSTITLSNIEEITTGGGADTLDFSNFGNGATALTIDAGAGNDTITGSLQAADLLKGGAGDDTITGGAGSGSSTLQGGTGADSLIGGAGNDILQGGLGNDIDTFNITGADTVDLSDDTTKNNNITFATGGSTIARTTVSGSVAAETDNITALSGTDALTIVGSSKQDTINLTFGSVSKLTKFDGGANDTTPNNFETSGDTIKLSGNLAGQIINETNFGSATFSNIEVLDVTGATNTTGNITFNVADLYKWASDKSTLISDGGYTRSGGVVGKEILINISATDFDNYNKIKFVYDANNFANAYSSDVDFGSAKGFLNTPSGAGASTVLTGTSDPTAATTTTTQKHIYFDQGNTNNDLHVVINVVA